MMQGNEEILLFLSGCIFLVGLNLTPDYTVPVDLVGPVNRQRTDKNSGRSPHTCSISL